MAFLETQAVRLTLLIVAIAAVFAGMTFAGVAGFLALQPHMHPAWAAVIVAAVLIVPVLTGAIIVRARAAPPEPKPVQQQAAAGANDAAIALIAGMAQDKPLLAVLFAGLLGAAGTILQNRENRDRTH
jgi:hypothetical protein